MVTSGSSMIAVTTMGGDEQDDGELAERAQRHFALGVPFRGCGSCSAHDRDRGTQAHAGSTDQATCWGGIGPRGGGSHPRTIA